MLVLSVLLLDGLMPRFATPQVARAGWGLVLVLAVAMACLPPVSGPAGLPRVDALSLPFVLILSVAGLASGERSPVLAGAALTAGVDHPVLFCIGAAGLLPLLHARGVVSRGMVAWGSAGAAVAAALLSGPGSGRLAVLPVPALVAAAALMGVSLRPLAGGRHGGSGGVAHLAGVVVGLCLAARMLVVWPVVPVGAVWGGGVAVAGLALALVGGGRALGARDAGRVLAGMLAGWGGLGLLLVGLVMTGRADDLPLLALGAFRALMLLAGGVGMAFLAAILTLERIAEAAGSLDLARAGGLAVLMPRTSGLLALALAGLCALPPSGGFAVAWLLVQSLLALPRAEGLVGAMPPLATLAGVGLACGLLILAAVRLLSCLVLGRPRTPRAAGASDPAPGRLAVPGACLAGSAWMVLVPGGWLWLTRRAGWEAAGLAGPVPSGALPDWLALAAPGGSGMLYPLGVAALLALAGGLVWALSRLAGTVPSRPVAAWNEGAPPSPPWMPFGEPTAQAGPAQFAGMLPWGAPAGYSARRGLRRIVRLLRYAARRAAWLVEAGVAGVSRHAMGLVLLWLAVAALARMWGRS
ncbi:proton-conducting transporter transmembrane domain-containing protein [Gluconacetobacter sacchari]|uniref:NADH:quinone oxidoreductase/Mrp antiporter transmembrane domain-containing protein n=2 Tax=Gluconacetobacter sacchari TaxID=92759 RepID=A0A7W4IFZ4_9PROT|nr:proton-conducting transporter membrane subunit [Gluconacetobacter sacchari]MBB2162159.1 hypothetical protein [Gluconacetobacter sacchari]